MADMTEDPVGALSELRSSILRTADAEIDPMRVAAMQMMVDRCLSYEIANEGKNSPAMRDELAALEEAAREAGQKTGNGYWTSLRSYLRDARSKLRQEEV